ncbi:hypothetical protein GCM10027346_08560 [Hymenobacter seoulensis]
MRSSAAGSTTWGGEVTVWRKGAGLGGVAACPEAGWGGRVQSASRRARLRRPEERKDGMEEAKDWKTNRIRLALRQ